MESIRAIRSLCVALTVAAVGTTSTTVPVLLSVSLVTVLVLFQFPLINLKF